MKLIWQKNMSAKHDKTVFSSERNIKQPNLTLPNGLQLNQRQKEDGLIMMGQLPDECIPCAFLDPQYRGILNKLSYGNEGVTRGRARTALVQMNDKTISEFIQEISRLLIPTGHLFLWVDKFELLNGFNKWMDNTALGIVDMINWDKQRMGLGYRTRRITEYCVIIQKKPHRAKGVWKVHNIPDTWQEKAPPGNHPHRKPIKMQGALLSAVTNEDDIILDPCAGDFTVMTAAQLTNRNFLGCDLNG